MPQVIKIKRGLSSNLGLINLAAGEPAFTTDTGKLYVGDGTNKILINPDQYASATTADKLKTARTISLTGDTTGSASFDGSQNITITTTLGNITLSKISDAGTAASKNVGVGAGQVPILDAGGKLDTNVLPGLALTTTNVVNSQSAMLALTAEQGDLAIRTDLNKTFVLTINDPTKIANWQELLTPTDSVTSVNGKTGVIVLSAADIGLGNVTNESKATMFTSPAFTGVPTAPTAIAGTNTTQIATTEFVTAALAGLSTIDGGSF